MRSPRQLRLVAVTAAAIAGALVAAPAVLAALPKVDVYPEERCVSGPWPDGTEVTFTLRTAAGLQKASTTGTADDGVAVGCFDQSILPGDRIRIATGGESRTLKAIRLTLTKVDRVKDQVAGRTAAGRTVKVRVHRCPLGLGFSVDGCPTVSSRMIRSASTGRYAADVTGSVDVRGRDIVEIIVKNATGDRFRIDATVPVFEVGGIGKPFISGLFRGEEEVVFTLHDGPGGPVLGTVVLPSFDPSDAFRNASGDEVPVRPGQQVVGDFASDGRMVVPAMITSLDADADTVAAVCFPNQKYLLQAFGVAGVRILGTAAPNGAISLDLSASTDLVTDQDVRLTCMTKRGDTIRHDRTVP